MIDAVLHTAQDFEAFIAQPDHSEAHFELIHGEIVEKVPTEVHGIIAAMIVHLLLAYALPRDLGRVSVEARHQPPGDNYNVRLPDVAFTSTARALPPAEEGSVPQMPDLAVEIQSPNDRPREIREKAHFYLQNGSRLVWLVYPKSRSVEVCTLSESGSLQITPIPSDGVLDGGDILPGFSISVSEIFRGV
jgi:Uma2 family endonuclease